MAEKNKDNDKQKAGYKLFDGFLSASIPVQVMYLLTIPVGPIIVELHEATRPSRKTESNQPTQIVKPEVKQALAVEADEREKGTKFQEAEAQREASKGSIRGL